MREAGHESHVAAVSSQLSPPIHFPGPGRHNASRGEYIRRSLIIQTPNEETEISLASWVMMIKSMVL